MVKSVLFVVCSCFILLKGQLVSASCPFKITPSRVVVKFEDSFSVNCSSTTDQSAGMGWESSFKGTGLIKNVDYVLLDVQKVDAWTIASECFMTYKNGSQCLENLPVTVYKIPDAVSITSPNKVKSMNESTTYRFQCDVLNVAPAKNLTIMWYQDDKNIYNETFSTESAESPVDMSSVCPITPLNNRNQVKIRCEAMFDFGPEWSLLPVTSPTLELQVLYKPFFEEPKVEMVEVSRGGKIRLNCTAKGNPLPQYSWQVPQSTQKTMGSEAVVDLQWPFPGTYNCTALNSCGSRVKQFIVTDAPRDYTVLAAVVGVMAALGVLLLISGPFIVTKDGTFSLNKGGYTSGQPTSKPI